MRESTLPPSLRGLPSQLSSPHVVPEAWHTKTAGNHYGLKLESKGQNGKRKLQAKITLPETNSMHLPLEIGRKNAPKRKLYN